MPHLTVHALEGDLAGREAALAAALTDSIAAVYGEWARELVTVQLIGSLTDATASVFGEQTRARTTVELVATPAGRTGVGGRPEE